MGQREKRRQQKQQIDGTKALEELENVCRFCRGAADYSNAVRPCRCTNYLHQECYNEWMRVSGSMMCEVCKTRYAIKPVIVTERMINYAAINKCVSFAKTIVSETLFIAVICLVTAIPFIGDLNYNGTGWSNAGIMGQVLISGWIVLVMSSFWQCTNMLISSHDIYHDHGDKLTLDDLFDLIVVCIGAVLLIPIFIASTLTIEQITAFSNMTLIGLYTLSCFRMYTASRINVAKGRYPLLIASAVCYLLTRLLGSYFTIQTCVVSSGVGILIIIFIGGFCEGTTVILNYFYPSTTKTILLLENYTKT